MNKSTHQFKQETATENNEMLQPDSSNKRSKVTLKGTQINDTHIVPQDVDTHQQRQKQESVIVSNSPSYQEAETKVNGEIVFASIRPTDKDLKSADTLFRLITKRLERFKDSWASLSKSFYQSIGRGAFVFEMDKQTAHNALLFDPESQLLSCFLKQPKQPVQQLPFEYLAQDQFSIHSADLVDKFQRCIERYNPESEFVAVLLYHFELDSLLRVFVIRGDRANNAQNANMSLTGQSMSEKNRLKEEFSTTPLLLTNNTVLGKFRARPCRITPNPAKYYTECTWCKKKFTFNDRALICKHCNEKLRPYCSQSCADYGWSNGDYIFCLLQQVLEARESKAPNFLDLEAQFISFLHRQKKCACCLKKANKTCGQCFAVSYCDKDCQKSNWKYHKKYCTLFQVIADIITKRVKATGEKGKQPAQCEGNKYKIHLASDNLCSISFPLYMVEEENDTVKDLMICTIVRRLFYSRTEKGVDFVNLALVEKLQSFFPNTASLLKQFQAVSMSEERASLEYPMTYDKRTFYETDELALPLDEQLKDDIEREEIIDEAHNIFSKQFYELTQIKQQETIQQQDALSSESVKTIVNLSSSGCQVPEAEAPVRNVLDASEHGHHTFIKEETSNITSHQKDTTEKRGADRVYPLYDANFSTLLSQLSEHFFTKGYKQIYGLIVEMSVNVEFRSFSERLSKLLIYLPELSNPDQSISSIINSFVKSACNLSAEEFSDDTNKNIEELDKLIKTKFYPQIMELNFVLFYIVTRICCWLVRYRKPFWLNYQPNSGEATFDFAELIFNSITGKTSEFTELVKNIRHKTMDDFVTTEQPHILTPIEKFNWLITNRNLDLPYPQNTLKLLNDYKFPGELRDFHVLLGNIPEELFNYLYSENTFDTSASPKNEIEKMILIMKFSFAILLLCPLHDCSLVTRIQECSVIVEKSVQSFIETSCFLSLTFSAATKKANANSVYGLFELSRYGLLTFLPRFSAFYLFDCFETLFTKALEFVMSSTDAMKIILDKTSHIKPFSPTGNNTFRTCQDDGKLLLYRLNLPSSSSDTIYRNTDDNKNKEKSCKGELHDRNQYHSSPQQPPLNDTQQSPSLIPASAQTKTPTEVRQSKIGSISSTAIPMPTEMHTGKSSPQTVKTNIMNGKQTKQNTENKAFQVPDQKRSHNSMSQGCKQNPSNQIANNKEKTEDEKIKELTRCLINDELFYDNDIKKTNDTLTDNGAKNTTIEKTKAAKDNTNPILNEKSNEPNSKKKSSHLKMTEKQNERKNADNSAINLKTLIDIDINNNQLNNYLNEWSIEEQEQLELFSKNITNPHDRTITGFLKLCILQTTADIKTFQNAKTVCHAIELLKRGMTETIHMRWDYFVRLLYFLSVHCNYYLLTKEPNFAVQVLDVIKYGIYLSLFNLKDCDTQPATYVPYFPSLCKHVYTQDIKKIDKLDLDSCFTCADMIVSDKRSKLISTLLTAKSYLKIVINNQLTAENLSQIISFIKEYISGKHTERRNIFIAYAKNLSRFAPLYQTRFLDIALSIALPTKEQNFCVLDQSFSDKDECENAQQQDCYALLCYACANMGKLKTLLRDKEKELDKLEEIFTNDSSELIVQFLSELQRWEDKSCHNEASIFDMLTCDPCDATPAMLLQIITFFSLFSIFNSPFRMRTTAYIPPPQNDDKHLYVNPYIPLYSLKQEAEAESMIYKLIVRAWSIKKEAAQGKQESIYECYSIARHKAELEREYQRGMADTTTQLPQYETELETRGKEMALLMEKEHEVSSVLEYIEGFRRQIAEGSVTHSSVLHFLLDNGEKEDFLESFDRNIAELLKQDAGLRDISPADKAALDSKLTNLKTFFEAKFLLLREECNKLLSIDSLKKSFHDLSLTELQLVDEKTISALKEVQPNKCFFEIINFYVSEWKNGYACYYQKLFTFQEQHQREFQSPEKNQDILTQKIGTLLEQYVPIFSTIFAPSIYPNQDRVTQIEIRINTIFAIFAKKLHCSCTGNMLNLLDDIEALAHDDPSLIIKDESWFRKGRINVETFIAFFNAFARQRIDLFELLLPLKGLRDPERLAKVMLLKSQSEGSLLDTLDEKKAKLQTARMPKNPILNSIFKLFTPNFLFTDFEKCIWILIGTSYRFYEKHHAKMNRKSIIGHFFFLTKAALRNFYSINTTYTGSEIDTIQNIKEFAVLAFTNPHSTIEDVSEQFSSLCFEFCEQRYQNRMQNESSLRELRNKAKKREAIHMQALQLLERKKLLDSQSTDKGIVCTQKTPNQLLDQFDKCLLNVYGIKLTELPQKSASTEEHISPLATTRPTQHTQSEVKDPIDLLEEIQLFKSPQCGLSSVPLDNNSNLPATSTPIKSTQSAEQNEPSCLSQENEDGQSRTANREEQDFHGMNDVVNLIFGDSSSDSEDDSDQEINDDSEEWDEDDEDTYTEDYDDHIDENEDADINETNADNNGVIDISSLRDNTKEDTSVKNAALWGHSTDKTTASHSGFTTGMMSAEGLLNRKAEKATTIAEKGRSESKPPKQKLPSKPEAEKKPKR